MAKIGLNFGEKLQIVDKSYRVITDGLIIPEVFGKLTFRSIEGNELMKLIVRNAMKMALMPKYLQEKSVG